MYCVGACSNPTDFYRHDANRGDNAFNILWWYKEHATTDEEGKQWGSTPNSWYARLPAPGQNGTVMRSIVLFPNQADSE